MTYPKKIKHTDKEEDVSEGRVTCDVANRIVNAKLDSKNNVHYEIEWRPRYDKSMPKNTLYPSPVVRDYYPQLVLDFIESEMMKKRKK
jgi:hypothetical protein